MNITEATISGQCWYEGETNGSVFTVVSGF